MKNKKFLPLVILVGVVALLGILLAVLTLHGEAETDTTLPLCDLAVDDIDALSYAGNNVEVSLLKGSDGWLLADDPSLPLDQTKVQSLVEDYANLKAQRKLEGDDLAELPAKSDTPQMTITLGAGEQTVDLTVDQLNSVADVYYVYDESGAAYTVRRSDLATLSKSPRDLYKAQTLTDKEYQIMRNASIAILREIGVDTGGSNVQFAVNPKNGRLIVIEMNPRVSRSSALASKATGFPIAKVAAKLAVGYTLDELRNDITGGKTPISFEPTIDYVVTKMPRFAFEKFPQADDRLTTQMKAVGEVMAIGRTFQESFQKALRGLETGKDGLDSKTSDREQIVYEISDAGPERIFYVGDAFRIGMTLKEVQEATNIDPWFLIQIQEIIDIVNVIEIDIILFRIIWWRSFSHVNIRNLYFLFSRPYIGDILPKIPFNHTEPPHLQRILRICSNSDADRTNIHPYLLSYTGLYPCQLLFYKNPCPSYHQE